MDSAGDLRKPALAAAHGSRKGLGVGGAVQERGRMRRRAGGRRAGLRTCGLLAAHLASFAAHLCGRGVIATKVLALSRGGRPGEKLGWRKRALLAVALLRAPRPLHHPLSRPQTLPIIYEPHLAAQSQRACGSRLKLRLPEQRPRPVGRPRRQRGAPQCGDPLRGRGERACSEGAGGHGTSASPLGIQPACLPLSQLAAPSDRSLKLVPDRGRARSSAPRSRRDRLMRLSRLIVGGLRLDRGC